MRLLPVILSILALSVNCFAREPEQSKTIETQTGEAFTITLKANLTTGYQWQLAKPAEEGAVQLISSEYSADKTGLAGSGGKQVWVFKALKAGKSNIAFQYVRPWEKDSPPEKEESFAIVVK